MASTEDTTPPAPAARAPETSVGDGIQIVPGEKPNLKLIWLDKSRADRLTWLLEELGLEYEVEVFKRGKDMLAPHDLKKFHPLGKSPILIVNGVPLAESGNIVEFLVDNFGLHLKPSVPNSQAALDYRYFMHYAEGTLMAFLAMALLAHGVRNAPVPFFIKPITSRIANLMASSYIGPNVDQNFAFLEAHLKNKKNGWFVGDDISGADFMLFFCLYMSCPGVAGGLPLLDEKKYPTLREYINKIQERPAYKKSRERTDKVIASL